MTPVDPSGALEAPPLPAWAVALREPGASLTLRELREGEADRSPERRRRALREMLRVSRGIWEGVDVERYLDDLRGG